MLQASACRAASSASCIASPRITRRTMPIDDGAMLSSCTPRPTSSGTSDGSEAICPQMLTQMLLWRAASTVRRINSRIAGWEGR